MLAQQFPASILAGARGAPASADLPDDLHDPGWAILMPAPPGVTIQTSDILKDDLGRRFDIASAELTPLGWRLAAIQAQV